MIDIVNINSDATFINYADDTSSHFSAENVDALFDMANQAISALAIWRSSNLLQINVKNKNSAFSPKT